MKNRDEKGRFVKGNKIGQRYRRNGNATDDAVAMGKKGNEVIKARKQFKDVLKDLLEEEIPKPDGTTATWREFLAVKLREMAKKDYRALEMLIKIAGEMPNEKHDVNLSAQRGITIICESKEDEELHKRLMEE